MPWLQPRSRWIRLLSLAAAALGLALEPAWAATLPFDPQPTISGLADGPRFVIAADIDGDGDLDVVSASGDDDEIAWYENTGAGIFGAQQPISNLADFAVAVHAADLDGDGDLDVLSASTGDDEIAWYENTDGAGTFGAQQIISTAASNPLSITTADIDRDGDLDVLSASNLDDEIAWYENTDGTGSFGGQQIISTLADGATWVATGDIDGDGDEDVLSASLIDDEIAWYENTDGAGNFGGQQVITNLADAAFVVATGDIDGDGDLDVLSASSSDDEIAWYENTDGAGSFGGQQVISSTADGAYGLTVVDLDGDGDLDLLSSALGDDELSWYEHLDGAGTFAAEVAIDTLAGVANSVGAADLDGDGDLDLLSASFDLDRLVWYENETIHRSASFAEPQVVGNSANQPSEVRAADIDGDGDLDLVAAANSGVSWYENDGSPGGLGDWTAHLIATGVPQEIALADFDRDGDIDVATDSFASPGRIRWYENTDGAGSFGAEQLVVDDPSAILENISVADLDGDGDLDLLSGGPGSSGAARVAWHANDGTPGGLGDWALDVIDTGNGIRSVVAGDIDGDGALDVVTTGQEIYWYANNGLGSFGAAQEIVAPIDTIFEAELVDVDGDGDLDVVAGLFVEGPNSQSSLVWYENDGTPGGMGDWVANVVDGSPGDCRSVAVADLDADGDLDILLAARGNDRVAWYENLAGDASTWTRHEITGLAERPSSVIAADLDGDGDLDVVGTSSTEDLIAWYENQGGQFRLVPVDVASGAIFQGVTDRVLATWVVHNGRVGDGDLELASLELRFEDDQGTPLSSGQANALIDTVEVYRDDDVLVGAVGSLSLTSGVETIVFGDGDPNVQIAPGVPRAYVVLLTLTADAASQTPSSFRVVHVTEASSSAEDRDHDLPLTLEAVANSSSGVVKAWSADTDGDGLADHEELALGTNAALADSDADGLLDGEEVNDFGYDAVSTDNSASDFDSDGVSDVDELTVHGTNPFAADTDGDGADDGTELGMGGEPLDSPIAFASHSIGSESDTPNPAAPPVDIDGDGDLDFLMQLDSGTELVWYENANGDALSWTRRPLVTDVGAVGIGPDPVADLDGDGDPDVVALVDAGVSWFENSGSYGSDWSESTVVATSDALLARTEDVDRDGDVDVVVTLATAGDLNWYENDGSGGTWTPHTVFDNPGGAGWIPAGEDLDGDGTTDFVTTVLGGGPLILFWNNEGTGLVWGARELAPTATLPGTTVVTTGDLDRDARSDMLVTIPSSDRIDWLENESGDASLTRRRSVSRAAGFGTVGASVPFLVDFDLDGDLDAIPSGADPDVAWYENTGDGSLWLKRRIVALGPGPLTALPPADLDGDGDVDLVVADPVGGGLTFYENRTLHGSALYGFAGEIATGDFPEFVAAGDFDRDGDPDLAVVAVGDDAVEWYENTSGDGTAWGPAQTIDAGARATSSNNFESSSISVSDLDGDGDLDLLANTDLDDRTVWHENRLDRGEGWVEHLITHLVADPTGVIAADIDGDGDPDPIVGSHSDSSAEIAWMENDGLSFGAPTTIVSGGERRDFQVGDVDGDGDLDVVSQESFIDDISWYENELGDGSSWVTHGITTAPETPRALSLGDIDGDGDLDVVTCSTSAGLDPVEWYENRENESLSWVGREVAADLTGCSQTRSLDLDRDGDRDILAIRLFNGGGPGMLFYENVAGDGTVWTVHTAVPEAVQGRGAVVDLDRDGLLDVVVVRPGVDRISLFPNRGGQFGLPTADVAPTGGVDGRRTLLLEIEAAHRGRSGDNDLELATLELRFEDDLGTPLTSGQANDLVTSLTIHADDGDGVFEDGIDSLVATLPGLSLTSGVQTVTFSDADPLVQVAPETSQTYFVVVDLASDASSQTPGSFQVVHLTESSSTAEDRDNDLPLRLEFFADTTTGVVQTLAVGVDSDSDGLSNEDEVDIHGTDPGNPDTDGDGLNDGPEVNTHGSDPLDTDTDDDGLDDAVEVLTTVTDPADPDHDGDGFCDGPDTGGGACTPGDNCPAVSNGTQTNSDAFPAGDSCQCGDVTNDGVIDATDVLRAREHVVNRTPSGPFVADRCNVVGPADAGATDCTVEDLYVLERAAAAAAVTLGDVCDAYLGP